MILPGLLTKDMLSGMTLLNSAQKELLTFMPIIQDQTIPHGKMQFNLKKMPSIIIQIWLGNILIAL